MKKYGEQGERLSNLEALNGAQSLCCFLWAWIILQVRYWWQVGVWGCTVQDGPRPVVGA